MLLNELTGVKSQKDKTAIEIVKMMQDQYGIKAASGMYGVVVTKPEWDYVVKFFPKDNAYLKFVEYAIKNPSPHYPKFKRNPIEMSTFFKHDSMMPDKFYAVRIEKLKPCSDENLGIAFDVVDYEYSMAWREGGDKELKQFCDHEGMLDHFELAKCFCKLRDIADHGRITFDVHSGNVMQRGDGTIVIVDPFANFREAISLKVAIGIGIEEITGEAFTKDASADLSKGLESMG